MKMNRHTFNVLRILFFLCTSLLVAGFIYGVLTFVDTSKGSDANVQANAERLRASAQVYYSRLQFYEGVCEDIGTPRNFTCVETDTAYALSARLTSGKHYCVDSSGFSGIVPWPVRDVPSCRNH